MRFAYLSIFFAGLFLSVTVQGAALSGELEAGQRIYLEGILPSGAELTGTRFGNNIISGADAACVNCHRRSGMGQVEGDIHVQPITGKYLYASGLDKPLATMDPRVSKRFNQVHEPYTDVSLAKAITNGVNNQGREINVSMPHYRLKESETRALIAYLKQLSSEVSPGVTESNIHFATVITPDVSPLQRKSFTDMMRTILRQKNGSTVTANKGTNRHHMTSAAELMLGTERNWTLDIWELKGPKESWAEQLTAFYQAKPVFALISGLSNSTWQPVHDFCDRQQVPCWFPSIDLPVNSSSQYSLYFSGGVTLEAEVLAKHLLAQKSARHLVQVYQDDEVGNAAAQALSKALSGSNISLENIVLGKELAEELTEANAKIKPADTVMFWLRPAEIAALTKIKPLAGNHFFSTFLARSEHPQIPAEWKASSHLVYPYELPEKRKSNLDYFHAWLNISKLPLVDETMQSETFFAMNFLTDTISEMLDNLYREYLLERAEIMLSKREGRKAEQETRDRQFLGLPGDMVRKYGPLTAEESHRVQLNNKTSISKGTTFYPHLSLGPGQRLASKGAYIVHFAEDDKLIAESAWIVP